MKKTRKSTKLSTKHGTERYHSRVQNIGDIDSKLKHIKRTGYDINCYFGDLYKYLCSKNKSNNNVIVYEDNLYIFDKSSQILITTYPIPEKYLPSRKYFLSSTKRNIIENISDYINKVIVINYFNKKVTAKLLNMKIMFNNAYFTAIATNGELLEFSFNDIYDFVLSKKQELYDFSFQNTTIKNTLLNYFLGKEATIFIKGFHINVKVLNLFNLDNEVWFRILENNSINFINSSDIYAIEFYSPNENILDEKLYSQKKNLYKSIIRLNEIRAIVRNIEYLVDNFNIYELKNCSVIHSTLGSGKISNFILNTIIVDFDNGKTDTFSFPDCFENNVLKIINLGNNKPITKSKMNKYRNNLSKEKRNMKKSIKLKQNQVRLKEIKFDLLKATNDEEIDSLISEKEILECKLFKETNIKDDVSLNNSVFYEDSAISESVQEQFIDSYLGKEVILFCEERTFKGKIINKLRINKKLWIRIKKISNTEFIKGSDLLDIKNLDEINNYKDKVFAGYEQLCAIKRKMTSSSIMVFEMESLIQNLNILSKKFNILGVKNVPVFHKSFGKGKISYFIRNTIIVDFDNGTTKEFTFPNCFDDNILVLNTSQRRPIIAPSQLTNTKNAYLEQLNHHQHLLELLTIQYQIEKLNIKLHKFKVEDYENIIKEKCSLEKDFFKKRLKYNIE